MSRLNIFDLWESTTSWLDQYYLEMTSLRHFQIDTAQNYLSCLHQYLDYARQNFGNPPLRGKINPLHPESSQLDDFLTYLKQKGVSSSRLTHYRAALNGFFDMLYQRKINASNPAQKLPFIRREKSNSYKPVSTTIMFQLLNSITDKQDYLMIALFWSLGLRLSELLNLRKKHFKMIDQHNKIGLLTINGKGRKQRSLFVVERLFDAFCEYVNPLNANALLFSSPTKPQPLNGSTVIRRINKHLKIAGLGESTTSWNGRITPHMLRHSFATEMYQANVPLEDIRQMMGHESLRDTTIYIHVPDEKLHQALNLLTLKGSAYVV